MNRRAYDPPTLRALARDLDERTEKSLRECSCAICLGRRKLMTNLAADYRTWAFKAEDALTGPTVELPIVDGAS